MDGDTSVGIRLLIPTKLRDELSQGDEVLRGLGSLELARMDSYMSATSPSLSERMRSLVVTDTDKLTQDLEEVLAWNLEFANNNGWLLYETIKVMEEKKKDAKGKLKDLLKKAIDHVTALTRIATTNIDSVSASRKSSASPSPSASPR
jgi:hypothetical protein